MKKREKPTHTLEEINAMFRPIDLNEDNINAIFKYCLFQETDDFSLIQPIHLLNSEDGFDQVDTPINFNKNKLKQNRLNILYLLGQLDKTHNHENGTPFEYPLASIKYDQTQWTTSPNNLSKIFYLGNALSVAGDFSKRDGKTYASVSAPISVKSTLSPNDPNFDKWWAEHKTEWED